METESLDLTLNFGWEEFLHGGEEGLLCNCKKSSILQTKRRRGSW